MYSVFERLLAKHGITAWKVSKETGISTVTLTNWKKGNYVPKADKLQKIADYFGVSLEYLMTGKEPEHESTTGKKYYFSDETAEAAQEIFDDPDLHALFSMAKDSGPDNVRFVTEMLKRLKETNPNG